MRKIFAIAALGLALLSFGGTPALAQDAQRDAAVTACSVPPVSAEACNAALVIYMAAVKTLPPRQADIALANLVNVLAASSLPETRAIISAAIVTVSDNIQSTVVKDAALAVSDQVATGQPVTIQVAQLASAN
jgi:hypothetical protein